MLTGSVRVAIKKPAFPLWTHTMQCKGKVVGAQVELACGPTKYPSRQLSEPGSRVWSENLSIGAKFKGTVKGNKVVGGLGFERRVIAPNYPGGSFNDGATGLGCGLTIEPGKTGKGRVVLN